MIWKIIYDLCVCVCVYVFHLFIKISSIKWKQNKSHTFTIDEQINIKKNVSILCLKKVSFLILSMAHFKTEE